MTSESRGLSRRTLIRGALACSLLLPAAGVLTGCVSGGSSKDNGGMSGAKSAGNPFGLADNSSIEAVIFNGGYGYAYVTAPCVRC